MPQIFGWQHLIYVAICIVFAVAVLVCAKLFVKTEKAKEIMDHAGGGCRGTVPAFLQKSY